ncbi:hypothetical protein FGD77_12745 [Roseovarius sp. M141]|nr:hypothetical protein [Roseovarius sp. M141]
MTVDQHLGGGLRDPAAQGVRAGGPVRSAGAHELHIGGKRLIVQIVGIGAARRCHVPATRCGLVDIEHQPKSLRLPHGCRIEGLEGDRFARPHVEAHRAQPVKGARLASNLDRIGPPASRKCQGHLAPVARLRHAHIAPSMGYVDRFCHRRLGKRFGKNLGRRNRVHAGAGKQQHR